MDSVTDTSTTRQEPPSIGAFVVNPAVAPVVARLAQAPDLAALNRKTEDELLALKREWYDDARAIGLTLAISMIARLLGRDLNARYGPKYRWEAEGVSIYLDSYGGYSTVHVGDRQVYSSHDCSRYCIPGPWVAVVLRYGLEAVARQQEREAEASERRRQELLASISGRVAA